MIRTLFFLLIIVFSIQAVQPVVILMGPPGSGKGTFSQYFKKNYGFNHISAGDLVRDEIQNKTELGKSVEQIVKEGNYLPTQLMHNLIEKKILELVKFKKPFIIDGFIRSEEDFLFLKQLLKDLKLSEVTIAVLLNVGNNCCEERILNRLICSNCHEVYNLQTSIPVNNEYCDQCGGHLIKRINDSVSVIRKRINDYQKTLNLNLKVMSFYKSYILNAGAPLGEVEKEYQSLYQQFAVVTID